MRVDRFSPFTYGRDVKVSSQDPNTLYVSQRRGLIERRRTLPQPDVGKTWERFDKVTPHGTLMSVGLHDGDAKQVYVAAAMARCSAGSGTHHLNFRKRFVSVSRPSIRRARFIRQL